MAETTPDQTRQPSVSEAALHLLLLLAERQEAFSRLVAANQATLTPPDYSRPLLTALANTVQKVQTQFPHPTPTKQPMEMSATLKFKPS